MEESSNESINNEWKAEEAIAGNSEALLALRELIAFPLLYSSHAQHLGLKVFLSPFLTLISDEFECFLFFNFFLNFELLQWRRGLLLYGPPGTGKVSQFFSLPRLI